MNTVSIHEVGFQSTPALHIGDEVLFTAPSGRDYDGVVLQLDEFCGEAQVIVWFPFEYGNRVITSKGWQPLSRVRKLDDEPCQRCDGYGYVGIRNGDDALTCPECQGTGVKS